MHTKIHQLLANIKTARAQLLTEVEDVSPVKGSFKIDPDTWNLQEVIEHLVLAERLGFDMIYTAAEKYRLGNPIWDEPSSNSGLSIETIIDKTWKPKESAPDSAAPTGKWSLGVWVSHLRNCDDLLLQLAPVLSDLPLEKVIYPHFLCGPLDVMQRLDFIRFHIERHHQQVMGIKHKIT